MHNNKPFYGLTRLVDPDWVPSLHFGHTEVKATTPERFAHRIKQKIKMNSKNANCVAEDPPQMSCLHTSALWCTEQRDIACKAACHISLRRHNGNRIAVIVDCFEISIERASTLKTRAQTFTHYMHTVKYLVFITLQGAVFIISKVWGQTGDWELWAPTNITARMPGSGRSENPCIHKRTLQTGCKR
ncbi:hypothetical protein XENORESO_019915 [Xenotaenia resolanae]|uniref:DDE Tnp4 domain-containing protein n=1 Tax=Xenotaenia resolanae TaxID=208358 RepID=A0ABV0WA55_9TELE